MYRRTSDHSLAAGIYHSDCRCRVEIRVRAGDEFPRCPRCQREVGWMFTRSIYATDGSARPAPVDPLGGEPEPDR